MTTPDLSTIVPLKYKTLVAAISAVLTIAVPYILQGAAHLPAPWPVIIGGVFAALGVLGVWHAPYVPAGHAIVPQAVAETVHRSLPPAPGEYANPWRPANMKHAA